MKTEASDTITGTLQQLLFSPKGKLEGLLLDVHGNIVQVSMAPEAMEAGAMQSAIGQRLVLEAIADHSPKTKHAVHPVFTLEKVKKGGEGKAVPGPGDEKADGVAKGVVAAIHYARHGQPNGVVLESGEFIHLRPHGMEQCDLRIGSEVTAQGRRRMTVLGNPLIEARTVNRQTIE